MQRADRGLNVLSVDPHGPEGWVAVGLDDQGASRPSRLDAGESCVGAGITRAEVMEYLSQTYGPVFVADLSKHLSPCPGCASCDRGILQAARSAMWPAVSLDHSRGLLGGLPDLSC